MSTSAVSTPAIPSPTPKKNEIFFAEGKNLIRYQCVFLNELTPTHIKCVDEFTNITYEGYLLNDTFTAGTATFVFTKFEKPAVPQTTLRLASGKTFTITRNGKMINQFVCGGDVNCTNTNVTLVYPINDTTDVSVNPITHTLHSRLTAEPILLGEIKIQEAFVREADRRYTAKIEQNQYITFECVDENTPTLVRTTTGLFCLINTENEIFHVKTQKYICNSSRMFENSNSPSNTRYLPLGSKWGTLTEIFAYSSIREGSHRACIANTIGAKFYIEFKQIDDEVPTPLEIINNGIPEKILVKVGNELHFPKVIKFTRKSGSVFEVYDYSHYATPAYYIVAVL